MSDLDLIQTVWANQQKESFTMSIQEIRARSTKLQSTVRKRNRREYAVGALLIVLFGVAAFTASMTLAKIGCSLTAAGVAFVMWRMHVLARAASDEEIETTQNWVQFYRRELVRQRDALAGIWRWYLGPLVPGAVVYWLSVGAKATADNPVWPWVIMAGGLTLGGIIFAYVASMNKRAANELQNEIETLDRISKS
jgi:hypothetical protein